MLLAKEIKYSAIILAGGRGERFHGAKQFLTFHGKELWQWPFDIASSSRPHERTIIVGRDIPGCATRSTPIVLFCNAA